MIPDHRKRELESAARATVALERGPIKNLGGIMVDSDNQSLRFVPGDMRQVIQDIREFIGWTVERIDAGGTPTWAIK